MARAQSREPNIEYKFLEGEIWGPGCLLSISKYRLACSLALLSFCPAIACFICAQFASERSESVVLGGTMSTYHDPIDRLRDYNSIHTVSKVST